MSKEWEDRWEDVMAQMAFTREAIDSLSQVTADEEADMKLCFAGNALEGVMALLREVDAIVNPTNATEPRE